MSVGRLAEPPKPSFLLLGEVSQSHPFMLMHASPCIHTQRHSGGAWGARMERLSKCVRATGTTGQQCTQTTYSNQHIHFRQILGEPGWTADTDVRVGATWTVLVGVWASANMLRCICNMVVEAHAPTASTEAGVGVGEGKKVTQRTIQTMTSIGL